MKTFKAFTILELLVVLIISSVLIVLITVSYTNFFKLYVERKSLLNQSVDSYYEYSSSRELLLDKKLGENNFHFSGPKKMLEDSVNLNEQMLNSFQEKEGLYTGYYNQLLQKIDQEVPAEKLNKIYK